LRAQAGRFLFIFGILALAIATTAAAGLVGFYRSDWMVRHPTYLYDLVDAQRFGLAGNAYDIVVVGDSSGLQGVIPAVVETRLGGLSVVNMGLFGFSGPTSYRLLLENYLAHNSKPTLVVLHISATNPAYAARAASYERSYTVLRHSRLPDALRYFAVNAEGVPPLLVHFPSVIWRVLRHHELSQEMHVALDRDRGYSENTDPPLDELCRLDDRDDISNIGYFHELRSELAARNIPMLIYVAPMPECEAAYPYFVTAYRGVSDNVPVQMPNRYFVDYTHLRRDGAEIHSREFGDFLRVQTGKIGIGGK
jgi:hypothetical protein